MKMLLIEPDINLLLKISNSNLNIRLFSIDEFELESTRNVLILKANSSAQDTLFNLPYWNI